MAQSVLFEWLEKCSKLGSPGKNSLEYTENFLTNLKEELLIHKTSSEPSSPGAINIKEELGGKIHVSATELLSSADDNARADIRVVCGCYILAILHEIHIVLDELPPLDDEVKHEKSGKKTTEKPPASSDLISVHQTKVVEDAVHVVMYTIMLGCLSQEGSQYLKLTLVGNKFALGTDLVSISQGYRHSLLVPVMKIVVRLLKHQYIGVPLRGSLFPEILCTLLELCFAPGMVKEYPEDTAFFRDQLEEILSTRETNQTLQHLLLLKGIAKNGSWLQKVCGSFLVRRYLMQPGGVAAMIGAGLTICDGQDWKRCEAVAALVAHAKFQDMDLYYSTVGPQVSELMLKTTLKPEILRVVLLIISELAQRSATLTALHVTSSLTKPLLNLTNHQTASHLADNNLTLCVTRIHKLFVEIGVPSTSLINLLHPIIDPLTAVAAHPTSHLRSLAQQCIIRYLSQQAPENVVEILLHLSRLCLVSTIPTVAPDIRLCLDEEGGLRINANEESLENSVLEDDENLAKTIIAILEKMKNPLIVRSFYEKLVLYIDFSVLNKKETSPMVLLTDEDIHLQKFEAVRKVHICCSLLTNLADNEQLTNDLFQNLSEAIPIVDTLLKTGCQTCEDEDLNSTRASFIMNVVMMVSCYVNEQMLKQKMSSDDWRGLRSLLPLLEKIKENISNEAVLLFVEQLRNIVLTHGVIKTIPANDSEETLKTEKKAEQQKGSAVSRKEKVLSSTLPREIKRSDDTQLASHKGLGDKSKDKCVKSPGSEMKTNSCTSGNDTVGKKFTYKEAMEDIVSPVLPIRGHALLALGKLIEERDFETLSHKKEVLALFQHNLKEDDSYIYLMAIQGLDALCGVYPDEVVEILTKEFSIGRRTAEDRAKLAEVLARACRGLGPILPRYSSHFINSLLAGVRDTEAIVRASSLSSLGEVCKVLRFSLGPIIYELFGVLQAVIDGDKAAEVRRAAVLVLTMILQGLGHDAYTVLKDVIRDLYRVLRLVHARDPDDVVRLHTQLAMKEIDTITMEFLLPKLNLTKRIFVADLPPTQF